MKSIWKPCDRMEEWVHGRALQSKRLLKELGSVSKVAKEMGVNPTTVYRWLHYLESK